MSQTTPISTGESAPESAPRSNAPNAAVQRCRQARALAIQEARARNLSKFDSEQAGEEAYRNGLPPLSGYDNICDFIACITQGLITENIFHIDGPGLLYAAQVAISALRLHPKEPKQPGAPKDKKSRAA